VEKLLLAGVHILFGLPPVLSAEIDGRSRKPTKRRPPSRPPNLRLCEPRRVRLFGRVPACPVSDPSVLPDTSLTGGQGRKRFLARFQ